MNYQVILDTIEKFYEVAKRDVMIGYHFRVIENFDEHIPRIADFWNLQLNGALVNKDNLPFNLIGVHIPLGIKSAEINRWVLLFTNTLTQQVSIKQISIEEKEIFLKKVELFKNKIQLSI